MNRAFVRLLLSTWTGLTRFAVSLMGLVNYLLAQVGIQRPGWLSSVEWEIPAVVLIGPWASVGGSRMIIFLAGLQDVPQELLESAEIDGANTWDKFRHVTLPLISPTVVRSLPITHRQPNTDSPASSPSPPTDVSV